MPIKIYWENDAKNILRCDVIGHWTSDDLFEAGSSVWQCLQSVPHTVHLIFDWSQNTRIPSRIIELSRYAEENVEANLGLLVVVGASAFIRSLALVAQRLAPRATRDLYFADTIGEACTLIKSQSSNPRLNPVS